MNSQADLGLSSAPKGPAALDFKSATLYALRIVLHSPDKEALLAALEQRMRDAGSFFENELAVLDASGLTQDVDWAALQQALHQYRLHPIGAVGPDSLLASARQCGLPQVDLSNAPVRAPSSPAPEHDVPPVAAPAPASPTPERTVAPAAMVINRQLRSGQRVYARDTDLIVIGVVGQGAEVIADGNIHVYGPLRGKAMAGARGDTSARIFTTRLDPELVAIAGVYRVVETRLDASLHDKAAFVHLEGDTLQITALAG